MGDDVRHIASLRCLAPIDVEFLNWKPLTDDEKSGRVGPRAGGGRFRRHTSKVLCELRRLMAIIEDFVHEAGTFEEEIMALLVDRMFFRVSRQIQEEDYDCRDCQLSWVTMDGRLSKDERFKHRGGGRGINSRRCRRHRNTNRAVNGG
jgi:hypothetical protein